MDVARPKSAPAKIVADVDSPAGTRIPGMAEGRYRNDNKRNLERRHWRVRPFLIGSAKLSFLKNTDRRVRDARSKLASAATLESPFGIVRKNFGDFSGAE